MIAKLAIFQFCGHSWLQDWADVYATFTLLLYTGNIYVNVLTNPLLNGNCLYVSKGYNVAFEFV